MVKQTWKGVASWKFPCKAPAFPAMLSISMPMVMRDGKACGLMMRSGRIPVRSQYGMSTSGQSTLREVKGGREEFDRGVEEVRTRGLKFISSSPPFGHC